MSDKLKQIDEIINGMDSKTLRTVSELAASRLHKLQRDCLFVGLKSASDICKSAMVYVNPDSGLSIGGTATWNKIAELAMTCCPEFAKGGVQCVLNTGYQKDEVEFNLGLVGVFLPVMDDYPDGMYLKELVEKMEKAQANGKE